MAIDFEISVRPLIHSHESLVKSISGQGTNAYLVDNKLYFSVAKYPQRNKDMAVGINSFWASGCKHGTGKEIMNIMDSMKMKIPQSCCHCSTRTIVSSSDNRAIPASNRIRAAWRSSAAETVFDIKTYTEYLNEDWLVDSNQCRARYARLGAWNEAPTASANEVA
jgi:hypothetical protein